MSKKSVFRHINGLYIGGGALQQWPPRSAGRRGSWLQSCCSSCSTSTAPPPAGLQGCIAPPTAAAASAAYRLGWPACNSSAQLPQQITTKIQILLEYLNISYWLMTSHTRFRTVFRYRLVKKFFPQCPCEGIWIFPWGHWETKGSQWQPKID